MCQFGDAINARALVLGRTLCAMVSVTSKPKGKRAVTYVIYKDLAKALRKESNIAVQYWFGVAPCTVSKWRKALSVPQSNEGTNRLFVAKNLTPKMVRARKKAWAKARDPERCAKIAASRRGKKRPPHVIEAMRNANLGRSASEETRRKMSEVHRKRGTRPPWLNDPWTKEEDALIWKYRIAEVVRRTGRTEAAVKSRRRILGVPDGRKRHV